MDAHTFIYNSLEKISEDFPQIHIKYAFNKIINTHIVELLPLFEYKNNSSLDDAWIPLSFAFREKYPEDEIAFVSSDSVLAIDAPIFEFNLPSGNFDLAPELFQQFSEEEFSYTFPKQIPEGGIMYFKSNVQLLRYPEQEVNSTSFDCELLYPLAA